MDIIKVKPHNKQVYMDIVRDIAKKKSGVLTFHLKVNAGLIVDYVYTETKQFKKRPDGKRTD